MNKEDKSIHLTLQYKVPCKFGSTTRYRYCLQSPLLIDKEATGFVEKANPETTPTSSPPHRIWKFLLYFYYTKKIHTMWRHILSSLYILSPQSD